MTDVQLYLAVGVPVVVNALFFTLLVLYINAKLSGLDSKFDAKLTALDKRIDDLRADVSQRFAVQEMRMARLEDKMDTLTGKVVELDNRLTRVEERLKI